jgi:hypothetical protein
MGSEWILGSLAGGLWSGLSWLYVGCCEHAGISELVS